MNLWFRLTWLWIVGRWRPQVHSLGPCRTPFRVSLFDLDLFRHMNNGRYFTIMDLARVDLMHRSGTLVKLNRAGLYPVVTAESLIFRKSLNWRQRFEIESEVVAWDEKSIVMSQRFLVGSDEVAGALVQARFLRRSGGSVPTADILALLGEDIPHPSRPPWLDDWMTLFGSGIPRAVRVASVALALSAMLPGCGHPPAVSPFPSTTTSRGSKSMPTDDAVASIASARARSNAAIAAHDTSAIAREWMPDIHVTSSTSSQTAGADANARAMATQFARRPDTKWVRTPRTIRVFTAWNVGAEEGDWIGTWTDPDGAIRITGTYVAQWRFTDGRWRIQAEVFVPLACEGGAYCRQHP